MKYETEAILMEIIDLTDIVKEAIINLENYGSNDHHIKLPVALKEAKMYLNDITERSKNIPQAQETYECSVDQLAYWTEEFNSTAQLRQKVEDYTKARTTFNNRLDDLKSLNHRTFRDSSETEAFITKNKKSIGKLKLKANAISKETDELETLLDQNIVAQSDSLMETLHDGIAKLRLDNANLVELNSKVEEMIPQRESELEDLKKSLISDARKHAEDLSARSKIIVDLFQNSKDGAKVAMLAGTAHKNITDAINSARDAADKAYEAAVFSNDKLNPIDKDEETMIEKGQDLSLESEAIQVDAEEQITKIKGKLHFLLP